MRSALRPPDIGAIITPKRDNAAVVLHALRRFANKGRRIIPVADSSIVGGHLGVGAKRSGAVHHAIREVRRHHPMGSCLLPNYGGLSLTGGERQA